MSIIVGTIIENPEGKYLLVQEAKVGRGKWSLPAGHLDPNETILDGAKREAREESGLEVELTGICQIGSCELPENAFISVIFTALQTGGEIAFDKAEIMNVQWFSYEEILQLRDAGKIRSPEFMLGIIHNVRSGIIAPLDLVNLCSAADIKTGRKPAIS